MTKNNKERFKMVATVHLFLMDGGKILLQRRYNTGYEDGNFGVPSGHIDGNESIFEAGIREAKEEIGIDISKEHLQFAGVFHRNKSDGERLDFFFAVENWQGDIVNKEPNKCDLLQWYTKEKLPENTIAYVRQAIELFEQGAAFCEYLEI